MFGSGGGGGDSVYVCVSIPLVCSCGFINFLCFLECSLLFYAVFFFYDLLDIMSRICR